MGRRAVFRGQETAGREAHRSPGVRDRAYGLSDEVRFFPVGVIEQLEILDETRPELPEPGYHPR